MDNNGQWIELQPLYHQQGQFVHGMSTNYNGDVTPTGQSGPSSPPGQKSSGEPDPDIEAIVDTNRFPDLKLEIESMLGWVWVFSLFWFIIRY